MPLLFHSKIYLQFIALVLFICILLPLNGSAHAAQVTLTWDPNTEPDVAGYRIYYGFASDQYSNRIDVGNQTSYTVASLAGGETYYFAATVYDQEGNESDFSDEVAFQAPVPCTFSVSPASQSFAADGGPAAINVTTQSGCTWVTVSNASWLVITSNNNVTGSGAANYSALSNSSGSTRTGTLTVAGQSITITQSGVSMYTITASAGSNGTISPQGTLTVNPGTNQTFTVRANWFYQIADVKIDGVSQGPIISHTFQDVNSTHSISATFVKRAGRRGNLFAK